MLRKILYLLLCLPFLGADYMGHKRLEQSKTFFGSRCTITVFGPDQSLYEIETAIDEAFRAMEKIEQGLSDQIESGLAYQINQSAAPSSWTLDNDSFYIFQESLRLSSLTEGALDMTDLPIKRLWLEAQKNNEPPTPDQVREARAVMGYSNLSLNASTKKLTVQKQGLQINLDDILMGLAVDKAAGSLKSSGVRSAIIKTGSSLRLVGAPPEGLTWRLSLEHPRKIDRNAAVLESAEAYAVATVGDFDNFFVHKNKRYPLLWDARTGLPPTGKVVSVTVITQRLDFARMLAKTFFALGPEKSFDLIDRLPKEQLEVVFVEEPREGVFVLSSSDGIRDFLKDIQL